jgi:hypothetical protein
LLKRYQQPAAVILMWRPHMTRSAFAQAAGSTIAAGAVIVTSHPMLSVN